MFGALFRKHLCHALTGERGIVLTDKRPSPEELGRKFEDIENLGIYLHIPFCKQICPYCPYNKELYAPDVAKRYTTAVKKEIDFYSDIVGNRPVTSLYVGGGTPTIMLNNGLADILEHIHKVFNVRCDLHLESHPNDLTAENLDTLQSLGVRHLSTGVESLQDKHLEFLKRPYTVSAARQAVERAMSRNFECVNVDVIFALPGQTCAEVEQAGHALVEMGVQQVAAYPLFKFPYTRMGENGGIHNFKATTIFKRRKMLGILERIFYEAGFERSSVWAFTRPEVSKYCSVTVPLYLGLGASGGSYLEDTFYLNTFNVAEYIKAIENRGTAIALSLDLSERMQMAGWLYWRIYETRFEKGDFERRFKQDFDSGYRKYIRPLRWLGFLHDDGERVVLTDSGTYWLHALEDVFSLEYIARLWGTSKQDPWPKNVFL